MGYPLWHQIRKRRNPPIHIPVAKPIIPPPEANYWWWHPNRVGVRGGPAWFEAQLRQFDPDLAVTWNSYAECYLIWMRAPSFKTKTCWGWKLLFPVVGADGAYRPLDELIFARLFEASARKWGNGRKYWQRIEAEMERDRLKGEASRVDDVGATARDWFQYASIKNIGKGNKFVNHWSG